MKSRNALFTALALGLTLSAPMAFAQQQDATAAPASQEQAAQDQAAQDAAAQQPADPAAQATDATAQQPTDATAATQAAPAASPEAAGDTKKITWSDLDTDKDGKLTKTEVASVEALNQVFDDADADKDGALTPDEYKAYVAKNQGEAAQPANGG